MVETLQLLNIDTYIDIVKCMRMQCWFIKLFEWNI